MVIAISVRLLIVLLLADAALGQEAIDEFGFLSADEHNHGDVVDSNRTQSTIVVAGKSVNCDKFRPSLYGGFRTDDGQQRRENPYTSWYSDRLPALPTCESPHENARGVYSSYLSPCEFAFHKSDTTKDKQGTLSAVCTSENKMKLPDTNISILKQYIFGWKDECLASFPRCYSLSKQFNIFIELLCHKRWEIPEGATHLSVDCTADAKLQKDKIAQKNLGAAKNDSTIVVAGKTVKCEANRKSEGFMTDDGIRGNPYTSRYSDRLPVLPTCESPSENARGVYSSYRSALSPRGRNRVCSLKWTPS